MRAYHDQEWGRPLHDEDRLFEMLCLEGAQAGLSWSMILNRREGYRAAYEGFDAERIAAYDDARQAELLTDERIIRNRAKVRAFRDNARLVVDMRESGDGLRGYLWSFVDGRPIVNAPASMMQIAPRTPLSERISADMKRRGFRFVGPVIVHAYMQSIGIVDDHTMDCFRRTGGGA